MKIRNTPLDFSVFQHIYRHGDEGEEGGIAPTSLWRRVRSETNGANCDGIAAHPRMTSRGVGGR